MAANQAITNGIAGRYAAALFDLARDAKALDTVKADLDRVAAMIAESPELGRVLRSPVLSREAQGRAVAAVLEAAGMGEMVKKFAGVVARNRRLFALSAMIEAFAGLLARHRGEVSASVTTAQPLSEAQQKALAEALQGATGHPVTVKTGIDENLIGGMILRVGSRMVDHSLAAKLNRLRLSMKRMG